MVKVGDWVHTPRFLKVKIAEVFDSEEEAIEHGYTEPTHLYDGDFGVAGKSLDVYNMLFAAYKR